MALLLVIALAAVAGCEAASTAHHQRRDPRALVVAKAADVQGLDLARVTDSESIEVGDLIFEGLVRWKPGTTDIEPGLATAWSTSPDGRHWTFDLRPGVTFHDGSPFDARAVTFSFERLLDPKHPRYLGESGAYWRSLLKDITAVTALSPLRVQIDVARPYAPLLGNLAMYPIVSPRAVVRYADDFRANPIGTGAFALESWVPGEAVVVKRYDHYWGPHPDLARIVFRVVVDARQRLVDLESGAVDVATGILPDEQAFVELHPDLELHHTPGNDVSYLAFNTQKPPFDQLAVRRAISHAINKEPIVKLAFQGRAVAADGPLPSTQWAYHPARVPVSYDIIEAKRALAQAAAAGTFDPDAHYKLYSSSTPRPYLPSPERVARFLQTALEQIGVHTDLVLQPHPVTRQALQAGEHDLALYGWIGDTGDPDNFLYVLFHSDNTVIGSASNIAFFRDHVVDQLLVEAQGATATRTRIGLYAAAQDRIAELVPWVPIAHSEVVIATRRDLRHVVLSPLGQPAYALISRMGLP